MSADDVANTNPPINDSPPSINIQDLDISELVQLSRLYFILGFDTITRLFETRFYGSKDAMTTALNGFFSSQNANDENKGDGSYVVCARRRLNGVETDESEEGRFLSSPEVGPYYQSGKILLMDLGETAETKGDQEEQPLDTISSTQARQMFNELGVGKPTDAGEIGNTESREIDKIVPLPIVEYVLRNKIYRFANYSVGP